MTVVASVVMPAKIAAEVEEERYLAILDRASRSLEEANCSAACFMIATQLDAVRIAIRRFSLADELLLAASELWIRSVHALGQALAIEFKRSGEPGRASTRWSTNKTGLKGQLVGLALMMSRDGAPSLQAVLEAYRTSGRLASINGLIEFMRSLDRPEGTTIVEAPSHHRVASTEHEQTPLRGQHGVLHRMSRNMIDQMGYIAHDLRGADLDSRARGELQAVQHNVAVMADVVELLLHRKASAAITRLRNAV